MLAHFNGQQVKEHQSITMITFSSPGIDQHEPVTTTTTTTTAVVTKITEKSLFKSEILSIVRYFNCIEVTIKTGATHMTLPMLPTIPSVDCEETTDQPSRPLAPLASSETFSDVAALANDDQPAKETLSVSTETDNSSSKGKTAVKTTKSDFDSLEVLFDFPSSGLSSDTPLETEDAIRTSTHIRFTEMNQIIGTEKV